MWIKFLLEGLKNFAGEIIGLILIAIFWRMFPRLRDWLSKLKKDDADDTDVMQTLENIQKQLEVQSQEKLGTYKWKQEKPKNCKFIVIVAFIVAIIIGIVFQQYISKVAMSDSDFLKLCESGDAKKVEEAIMNRANVNAKYSEEYELSYIRGCTALMLAAWNGDTRTVEILIKHGADVKAKNNNGITALMLAENDHVAEVLLKNGADINDKNDGRNTVLMLAASAGQTDVVEFLLKHGVDVNAKDTDGDTALMRAANEGYAETAEVLLKCGANVNSKNRYGWTALMSVGNSHVAKVLLKHGADVNARDTDGRTALMGQKDAEVVEVLLKYGANVDVKDSDGWTALMSAAFTGQTDVAELFLRHGADVNICANDGSTALRWAERNGHTRTANLLRKYGAKLQ